MTQPLQPPVQAGQNQLQSMNMNVSPEKRGALKDYMEGYKAAIESKTMNNLLPNISSTPPMPPQGMGQPPMMGGQPPMPPQGMPPQGMGGMPQQPPMMPPQQGMMPPQPYNHGGMVDVFDPLYMDRGGFVIQTDPSGKIATRPVFSEDRGRMVSQILSRDDVDEMKGGAGGGGLAKIDKVIEDAILGDVVKNIADDSLKGVPDYTTTIVEPETSDIIGPESKPNLPLSIDMLRVGEDVETSDTPSQGSWGGLDENQLSGSYNPLDIDTTTIYTGDTTGDTTGQGEIDTFDEARRLIKEANKKDANYLDKIENQLRAQTFIDPVYGLKVTGDDFSGDWKFYPRIMDGDTSEKKGISPEEMKQIGRMVLEGEKLSGPESDIFDMPNYDVGIDEVFAPAQTGVAGSDAPVVQRFPPEMENTLRFWNPEGETFTEDALDKRNAPVIEPEEQLSGLMQLLKLNPQLFPFLNLAGESDEAGLTGGMLGLSLFPSARAKAENYFGLPENYIKSLDKKAGINFNNGGIVQGFKPGGSVFRTNIKTKSGDTISGRLPAEVTIEELNPVKQTPFDSKKRINESIADTVFDLEVKDASGTPVNYGGGEGQLSGNYIATNYPMDHSSVVTPPYNFGPTDTEDPLANLINVSPTYPNTPPPGTMSNNPFLGGGSALGSDLYKAGTMAGTTSDDLLRMDEDKVESTGPVYEKFLKSQDSMFAPYVNKLGELMGKSPYDLYYTTQQNLKPDSMVSQIAKHRKLDQDRAEAKLAKEQRLRDMIAGMLPPTATPNTSTSGIGGMPTGTDPSDALVADDFGWGDNATTPDYAGTVVPSDRIPNFDLANLTPYPTFGVPGTSTYPTVMPSGISPELLRELFKMQGVPATAMNQGGSVNTLDKAVDNFLGSLRSAA